MPGSKVITTDERPGSEADSISSRNGTPDEQVLLQRHRDQLLDLLGRQPERLGLHLDLRGRELGIDIHWHAA